MAHVCLVQVGGRAGSVGRRREGWGRLMVHVCLAVQVGGWGRKAEGRGQRLACFMMLKPGIGRPLMLHARGSLIQ